MKKLIALVAALLLSFSTATAAEARSSSPRWRTVSTSTSMEGCGSQGLTMDANYRTTSTGTEVASVFVNSSDDMKNFPLYLSIVDRDGRVLYQDSTIGVGDGLDYLWTTGWERAHNGSWVRIGSDPSAGWSTVKGSGITVNVSQAEARYCRASLTIP